MNPKLYIITMKKPYFRSKDNVGVFKTIKDGLFNIGFTFQSMHKTELIVKTMIRQKRGSTKRLLEFVDNGLKSSGIDVLEVSQIIKTKVEY